MTHGEGVQYWVSTQPHAPKDKKYKKNKKTKNISNHANEDLVTPSPVNSIFFLKHQRLTIHIMAAQGFGPSGFQNHIKSKNKLQATCFSLVAYPVPAGTSFLLTTSKKSNPIFTHLCSESTLIVHQPTNKTNNPQQNHSTRLGLLQLCIEQV